MRNIRGFTLIELLIAIAILGILAALALSGSNNLAQNNRSEAFLLDLKRTISFARAKATTSDEIVIACPVNPSKLATRSNMSCENNWSNNNVIVFIDADNSGAFDNNDTLLRAMDLLPNGDKLTFNGSLRIRFDSSGRVTSSTGRFIYCPSGGDEKSKELTLAVSGNAFYKGDVTQSCP
ncbi:GspH/FimT family pseudopilin [Pseudoalteromonas sp. MMG005]|uniref:GspH/FimT family pseudopilin n=1 Tax=Pseudoalteromonas sp. MMG005 TaxID=2822682 RepID=UPI001B3A6570|nr:GspH/FimT family pseudopilin [Pseudoalteromonas sp. MMG005]MBQ4845815.1 GspH/FimT family pseudopilin [Pseudoalteromonas sp. MMG005]